MAMMMGTSGAVMPRPVVFAVVLTLINAVGGVLFTAFWPDLTDRSTVVGVSIVFGVVLIGFALWLRMGSRWGAIGTIVVNTLNILLGLPAFFESDAGFVIGASISIVLSALTIFFVLRPEARAFWQKPGPAAT
jgi:hypothetical protein